MKDKFIAYYRVSTNHQGINGLGMSAQRTAVASFLNGTKPIGEFAEVETGKAKERPQLSAAIALCRKTKATLLIAKLDRLARNAAFLLNLRDSGVDFVCCDMPQADRFTIGLFALLAEKERDDISARTKAGLAAAKRRGIRLGNPQIAKTRGRAVAAAKRQADAFAARLKPIVAQIEKAGMSSLQQIADCLNARGFKTPRGKEFAHQSVRNLLQRFA
jgi:DNA invertase Pin-like site-specific DNA recombinase